MSAAYLLLVECGEVAAVRETLEPQLCAIAVPRIVVHHLRLNVTDQTDATKSLREVVASKRPDLVIVAIAPALKFAASWLFGVLTEEARSVPVIGVATFQKPDEINDLLQLGAADYLRPPFHAEDVQPRIQRLLGHWPTRKSHIASLASTLGLKQIIGESPALIEQLRRIPVAARCDAGVLITGETGTGKEVCARGIHQLSARSGRPFIPVNCGAIPIELLENELFGHSPGAFTDAKLPHAGVIQEANEGTLFLDEIDALPVLAQVKLLRFLQEKEYRPLGARQLCKADVRIIAATNSPVEELIEAGKVRRDLFYRLNVLRVHLPPLRDRKGDIPLLARHFIAKHSDESHSALLDISPAALRRLSLYNWPGNVRELENVIKRAAILCTTREIQTEDLELASSSSDLAVPTSFRQLKAEAVAHFERSYLRALLESHRGNIAQAARAAQKNRRAFFHLMCKHHIHVQRSADGGLVVKVVTDLDKNIRPAIPQ